MTTLPPPKTPTVAIARVLRGLGLTQGRGCDFRVEGDYRNGERIGTYVLVLTRHADETIAAHADDIERLTGESGWAFRVSIRYLSDTGRPTTSVANYGDRVRQEPPAAAPEPEPVAAADPEPTPDTADEPPAPEVPEPGSPSAGYFAGARVRAWGRQRANALHWSGSQAYLVAAAATAGLSYDKNGVLRDRPRPGWTGTPVDETRLAPLVKAGFIAVTEPYGPGSKQVGITRDGAEALHLWRIYRPTPVDKDRKQEREPLRPLLGGEYAARRDQAAAEDQRRREAEREALYAALEELHAWEAWEDARWKVWATVNGITHRLGRRAPSGWMPTAEEIELHRLAPDVVAGLHADALRPRRKPELPKTTPARPLDVTPLPAIPAEAEQLDLFGATA
ncbi:hypothetical protein ACPCSP_25610 [Streptomyces cinereoruber]|uniref:hypothetical protein n=1 Tax=Streptomyces cinereoruber TaxID=67260 RepID=UPI003C2D1B75